GKLIAEGKGCGVDPTLAAVPSFHVRRKKRNLTHLTEGELHYISVRQLDWKSVQCLRQELYRALDLRIANLRVIKFLGQKNRPHERPQLVVNIPKFTNQSVYQRR